MTSFNQSLGLLIAIIVAVFLAGPIGLVILACPALWIGALCFFIVWLENR